MLILSRKTGTSIKIGDTITVTVLKVQGDRVQLAVDAPKGYKIVRPDAKTEPQK